MALAFSLDSGGVGALARFLVAVEFSLGYGGVGVLARLWLALEFLTCYGGGPRREGLVMAVVLIERAW